MTTGLRSRLDERPVAAHILRSAIPLFMVQENLVPQLTYPQPSLSIRKATAGFTRPFQGTFVIGSGTVSGTGTATDTNGNVYIQLL
jgi:hypothetical protein